MITSIVMAILERDQSFSFLKTQSLIGTHKRKTWRSFNLSDIVSITNLSRTPLEVNKKEKEKIEREKKKGYKCLKVRYYINY